MKQMFSRTQHRHTAHRRNWTRLGSFIAQQVPQYTAREVPMNKKDGSIVMVCMVYMPNLIDIVMI